MYWFIVKLVHRIVCGNGDHQPQFDEQLIMVQASNLKDAYKKGYDIGKNAETVFPNEQQQLVKWEFVNVAEIHSMNQESDGIELFSRIVEVHDAEAYCTVVNETSVNLHLYA